jgi:ribosomal protein L32
MTMSREVKNHPYLDTDSIESIAKYYQELHTIETLRDIVETLLKKIQILVRQKEDADLEMQKLLTCKKCGEKIRRYQYCKECYNIIQSEKQMQPWDIKGE